MTEATSREHRRAILDCFDCLLMCDACGRAGGLGGVMGCLTTTRDLTRSAGHERFLARSPHAPITQPTYDPRPSLSHRGREGRRIRDRS